MTRCSEKPGPAHVTGGKVFGYDNREVLSPEGRRLYVLRVVNAKEAAIIRQIFDMYADGLGIGRIAKRLNAENIAPVRWPRWIVGRRSSESCHSLKRNK